MDHYCIRCVAYWCRIAVVMDDFGFMRWNHASFGRAGTGRRHYRYRSRIAVVPRRVTVMTVVLIVLLLMVVRRWRMVLMAAGATAGAVR